VTEVALPLLKRRLRSCSMACLIGRMQASALASCKKIMVSSTALLRAHGFPRRGVEMLQILVFSLKSGCHLWIQLNVPLSMAMSPIPIR